MGIKQIIGCLSVAALLLVSIFGLQKQEVAFGAPRSPKWATVRANWLKTHPECAACGQRDDLNVHHVKPFSFDPSLELDPNNLITLCTDGIGHTNCHLMIGHGGYFAAYNPNVREDAARFRRMISERIEK